MPRPCRSIPVLACCLTALFLSVPAVRGEPTIRSWAADGGRNMVRPADNLPAELSERTLRWKVDSGTSRQYPMPAIAGDKVLIGGNGRGNPDPFWGKALRRGGSVVCRSMSDGKQLWRLAAPGNGRPAGFGVCGSPVVIGERVYILSVEDVYCLDLAGMTNGNDGRTDELDLMMRNSFRMPNGAERPTELPAWAADVIWHFSFSHMNVRAQDAISATPLVVDGQVWVSTAHEMGTLARGYRDRETGKYKKHPPAPRMLVLDAETGDLIAVDDMDVPVVWHGEWSSPSLLEVGGEKCVLFGDGYGVLHGLALPEADPNGQPVTIEEYWTWDMNPPETRYGPNGRLHPYSLDVRLLYKYPLGWAQDPNVWWCPPEDWATKAPGETRSYREMPMEEVKFGNRRKSDLPGPGKHNGPAELISMPVVVGNRVYLGIGRDYNYSGGSVPESRNLPRDDKGPRKFGRGRFMCLEFDSVRKPPRVVWEDRDVAHIQANASVADGLVYAADLAGFLNCWNAQTGEVVYKLDVGASVRERSQMVADGKVYVCNDRNFLRVYTAGPDPKMLSELGLRGHASTVAATDGAIIFTTPKEVFCYEKP